MAYVFTIMRFISMYWKQILTIMGLAVAGTVAYSVASSALQAQPAITQAIQMSTYAIPMLVYAFTIQMIFQMISTIMGTIRSMRGG